MEDGEMKEFKEPIHKEWWPNLSTPYEELCDWRFPEELASGMKISDPTIAFARLAETLGVAGKRVTQLNELEDVVSWAHGPFPIPLP